MKVLVTGGLGFIGSHTVVELQNKGFEVIIIDDCSNSDEKVLIGIEAITGKKPIFEKLDLKEKHKVEEFFQRHQDVAGVIHFAASKAVGESVEKPLLYYENNIGTLVYILKELCKKNKASFIFSSSCKVTPSLNAIALRYFNPMGAHPSGEIGELPIGVPQNLVPYITQTGIGLRKELSVFGDDYPTPDGTCIRDYIYVVDLAKAHVVALERLFQGKNEKNYEVFNVGTGTGSSVLEAIHSFEKVSGRKLNYKIVDRRAGDITSAYADTTKANTVLGWKAEYTLEEAMNYAWIWEQKIRD